MLKCYSEAAQFNPDNDSIPRHIILRDCMFTALTVLGFLVSLGILVTAAQSLSSNTNPGITANKFPNT
jgi:hypothetical protein